MDIQKHHPGPCFRDIQGESGNDLKLTYTVIFTVLTWIVNDLFRKACKISDHFLLFWSFVMICTQIELAFIDSYFLCIFICIAFSKMAVTMQKCECVIYTLRFC